MPRRRQHLVISAVTLGGAAISGAAFVWFWYASDQVRTNWRLHIETTLELERVTGYTGFIHDFKNAVLRPDEPHYIADAMADYDRAMAALTTLRSLAADRNLEVDLSLFEQALGQYRANLDFLSGRRAATDSIGDVDAMVRVSDRDARQSLDRATRAISNAYRDAYQPVRRAMLASLFACLLLLVLYGQELRNHARAREAFHQLKAQEAALDTEVRHRRDLAMSYRQLQQINREQAEMTYAISHDLKAPTNTALMLLAAVRQDLDEAKTDLPGDAAELIGDLGGVLTRMNRLVEDMLTYTRSLDTEFTREDVDLDAVLAQVLTDLRADIKGAGAEIRRSPLPRLAAHPPQMRQLFQNLVSNALKFRRPGVAPVVSIAPAEASEGTVAFTVGDNGIGIAEDQQDRIFALFARLHNRTEFDGSGLGLPICQRIAQTHGGDITLRSAPGEGSTFTITLKAA